MRITIIDKMNRNRSGNSLKVANLKAQFRNMNRKA